jgi:hypothetical protein
MTEPLIFKKNVSNFLHIHRMSAYLLLSSDKTPFLKNTTGRIALCSWCVPCNKIENITAINISLSVSYINCILSKKVNRLSAYLHTCIFYGGAWYKGKRWRLVYNIVRKPFDQCYTRSMIETCRWSIACDKYILRVWICWFYYVIWNARLTLTLLTLRIW